MSHESIADYYKTPFYVIKTNTRVIIGALVMIPGCLYEPTIRALEQNDLHLTNTYGEKWKKVLIPSLNIWLSDDHKKGPTQISSSDHIKWTWTEKSCQLLGLAFLLSHYAQPIF